ncbi:hypothetical protein STEG23_002717 [Scotinomys teguina]
MLQTDQITFDSSADFHVTLKPEQNTQLYTFSVVGRSQRAVSKTKAVTNESLGSIPHSNHSNQDDEREKRPMQKEDVLTDTVLTFKVMLAPIPGMKLLTDILGVQSKVRVLVSNADSGPVPDPLRQNLQVGRAQEPAGTETVLMWMHTQVEYTDKL